jgi:hypothetical protein
VLRLELVLLQRLAIGEAINLLPALGERFRRCRNDDVWREIGWPLRQAGLCLPRQGGCLSLSGRQAADLSLHQRGRRQSSAALLDHCMSAVPSQIAMHERAGATRRATPVAMQHTLVETQERGVQQEPNDPETRTPWAPVALGRHGGCVTNPLPLYPLASLPHPAMDEEPCEPFVVSQHRAAATECHFLPATGSHRVADRQDDGFLPGVVSARCGGPPCTSRSSADTRRSRHSIGSLSRAASQTVSNRQRRERQVSRSFAGIASSMLGLRCYQAVRRSCCTPDHSAVCRALPLLGSWCFSSIDRASARIGTVTLNASA